MGSEGTNRRKYPRMRVPKGMCVGWKTSSQSKVSRIEDVGLAGIFISTPNPPSAGTLLEMLFDLPNGEIRARAIVRRSQQGKGMGVQFVQMRPEDRAKLSRYMAAAQESQSAETAARESATITQAAAPVKESRANGSARAAKAPAKKAQPVMVQYHIILSPKRVQAADARFERDLKELTELTGKSSFYQLLNVTADATRNQIKKAYYVLARKYHPDSFAGSPAMAVKVQSLMVIITEAYRTLDNDEKRAEYDKRLATRGAAAVHRGAAGGEGTIAEWLERANECIRANNYPGSVVWLRKCVAAAPHFAAYHAMLARSLATVPRYQNDAIKHFEKAIELDPWKESVYLQFAAFFEYMKMPSRAKPIYTQLLEINPANAKALARLDALKVGRKPAKSGSFISHLVGRKG
jgi:tetratricopeptide (TPR) repeat protein